jgi:uncharacterized surface protein with fasciclin (FAS1) repeats
MVIQACIPPIQEAPPDPRTFDVPDTDLLDIGNSLPIFQDFMYALEKTYLTDYLEDDGPYTVFAPIHLSFDKFKIENRIYHIDQYPGDQLKEILKFHILPGNWYLLDMTTGYYPTILPKKTSGNPIDLYIDFDFIFKTNGRNVIFEPNLPGINGYMHGIKEILKVPTLLDQLSFNRNISMIHAIITRENLDVGLKQRLTDENPDTFFAPTKTALGSFLERNPAWEAVEDIPSDMVDALIRAHLLTDVNLVLNTYIEDVGVSPLNEADLVIKVDYPRWGILRDGKRVADIDIKDIQGSNGVIYPVDAVLMPVY